MRILWVCNTLPRTAAEAAGRQVDNKEGWLDGALVSISNADGSGEGPSLELAIAFPSDEAYDRSAGTGRMEVSIGRDMYVNLYGYSDDRRTPEIYDKGLEKEFADIMADCKPDIVHVFGTEYGHDLAVGRTVSALKKSGSAVKLLIGIQGIISECGRVYADGLPENVKRNRTFRDRIKDDNILRQQEKFLLRGEFELETITYATDITGRTEFDRNWSMEHNPRSVYHHMNETLRSEFYEGTWDVTECDRHVIFMSQGDYPLKGLHKIIRIMPEIAADYPDVKLIVAGMDITKHRTLRDRIRIGNYGKYLNELIAVNKLKDRVIFTGPLGAAQMKDMYLKSHAYICASSIENSPNSMGEAMLLGLPVIAARVGGIPSMIEDQTEGLLYDDVSEIPGLLHKIWDDDASATLLGAAGMNRAYRTHDAEANLHRLLEIYDELG